MPRRPDRKKSSRAKNLIEGVALLPWWAGVALALLSYLLPHRIGAQPLVAAPPGQMRAMFTQGLWKGMANVGQYVLPIMFLAVLMTVRRLGFRVPPLPSNGGHVLPVNPGQRHQASVDWHGWPQAAAR